MEGMIMDSERFDGLVRSFGHTRARRQTLHGLARTAALVALLAAKPVAAGKASKPNAPHKAPKNLGNSQPGIGQNGPLGRLQGNTRQRLVGASRPVQSVHRAKTADRRR